jgi:hypothetical protein
MTGRIDAFDAIFALRGNEKAFGRSPCGSVAGLGENLMSLKSNRVGMKSRLASGKDSSRYNLEACVGQVLLVRPIFDGLHRSAILRPRRHPSGGREFRSLTNDIRGIACSSATLPSLRANTHAGPCWPFYQPWPRPSRPRVGKLLRRHDTSSVSDHENELGKRGSTNERFRF